METNEIARHMITADWGIAIDRVCDGSYRVLTVSRIGGFLTVMPFITASTEAEAREAANREWRVQTGRPVASRWIGERP